MFNKAYETSNALNTWSSVVPSNICGKRYKPQRTVAKAGIITQEGIAVITERQNARQQRVGLMQSTLDLAVDAIGVETTRLGR